MQDLGLLELFAEKTQSRPALRQMIDMPAVFEHLSESLQRELDFRGEAANIDRMRTGPRALRRGSTCRACTASSRPNDSS